MSDTNRDEARNEGHGLDELEPLEEHSEERQEPEDDYYIRNYVLKEASEAEETPDAKESVSQAGTATVEAEEPTVEPMEEEFAEPPAFGSRTFAPGRTPTEPEIELAPEPEAVDETALSRSELLTNTLSDLLESSPNIEAAVLVSMDGLAMASALPDTMQEDRVAAMSAAILGLGERASAELGRGALNQVFVEGDDGYVFLMSAGGKAVLTALAGRGVKIGLVFYDMKHAAAKIAEAL